MKKGKGIRALIVDMHTHVFPQTLAQRALAAISAQSGGFSPISDGTVEGLRAGMAAADIDVSIIAPIATKPSQQANINDFAARCAASDIIPFGSVHPDAPDAIDELDRIVSLGLKGVKLHPEYQGFAVDEPRFHLLYRAIAQRGLITLFHAGRDIAYPAPCKGSPEAIASVLPYFEGAPVIAAHMGGYLMASEAMSLYAHSPVYVDTSMSYGRLPIPDAQALIDRLGPERVLFGSDSPWSPPADELRYVRCLGLDEDALALIMGRNAQRLLNIA